MICQKSEIENQQHTLAILNLLVSTLILIVAVVWMVKGPALTSAPDRTGLSSDPTRAGASGSSQEELLLQARLIISALNRDCAVVVVMPGEGIIASGSDCPRTPGEVRESPKAEERSFTLTVMATPESGPSRQVSEDSGGFIEL
jgi:hypothetical protein